MPKTSLPRPLRSALSFLKLTLLSFNRDYRETSRHSLREFVGKGSLLPSDRVLEVGCGRGRAASGLTRYLTGGSFDGFDILAGEIDWCRRWISRRHPRFRFQHADIYNKYYNAQGRIPAAQYRFPYEDGAFDFVYLTSVFTHMLAADVEHYLDEIARVLRPGGRCYISYFLLNADRDTPRVRERFPFGRVGCFVHSQDRPEWEVAYLESDVRAWYRQRGLEIREPITFGSWDGHAGGSGFQDVVIAVKEQGEAFEAGHATPPDVTVSIVSYNTRDLLRDCLLSLRERERAGEVSLEVVVADNGSTDGSAEMVRAEFPAVRLVETGGNVGYGRANNAALAGAQGRYVFILNSDTVVGPGALAALRDFLDAHPEAGAAGAQLILPDGAIQPSCAADPTLKSVFWEQTYFYKLFPGSPVTGGYALTFWDYQSPRAVQQVCGACLMVRRALYEQVGGFDPHYFMYFEDTDLCVRIRQTGAEIWFLPDAKIEHRLGGSSEGDWRVRARMIASYNKSRYYFFTRTEGRARGRLLKTTVLLGATLRAAAWSLLALRGRPGAREQARIWRSVWHQTRRMTSDGDAPPQPDLTSAAPCT